MCFISKDSGAEFPLFTVEGCEEVGVSSRVWKMGRSRSEGQILVAQAVMADKQFDEVSITDKQKYEEDLGVLLPDDFRIELGGAVGK